MVRDRPAVGCAKNRFVGEHPEPGPRRGDRAPLRDRGEVVGEVLRTRDGVRPVLVSPGHLIGVAQASEVVLGLCRHHRLPDPVRRADQLSRAALRCPALVPARRAGPTSGRRSGSTSARTVRAGSPRPSARRLQAEWCEHGCMPAALVDVLKALGNPTRLQIMEWLRTPEESFEEYEPIADRRQFGVCVTHLAAKTGLSQPTISTYMASLERAGLVQSTRIGKWTHYRRNDVEVDQLLEQLKTHL